MNYEQVEALWASIEHWYDNWEQVTKHSGSYAIQIEIGGEHCECCALSEKVSKWECCVGCPIFEHTGARFCRNTPWMDVYDRLGGCNPSWDYSSNERFLEHLTHLREDVEAEYVFLVELALTYKHNK